MKINTKKAAMAVNVKNETRRVSQFIMIDTHIFDALKKLKGNVLAVYMQLKAMLNFKTGKCCPSLATLGQALQMNAGSVSKAINTLKKMALVDWVNVKEGRYPTRYYFFTYPRTVEAGDQQEEDIEDLTNEEKAIVEEFTTVKEDRGPKPQLVKKTLVKKEAMVEEVIKEERSDPYLKKLRSLGLDKKRAPKINMIDFLLLDDYTKEEALQVYEVAKDAVFGEYVYETNENGEYVKTDKLKADIDAEWKEICLEAARITKPAKQNLVKKEDRGPRPILIKKEVVAKVETVKEETVKEEVVSTPAPIQTGKKKDKTKKEIDFQEVKKEVKKLLKAGKKKSSYGLEKWKPWIKEAEGLNEQGKVELALAKLTYVIYNLATLENYQYLKEYAFEEVITMEGMARRFYLEGKTFNANGSVGVSAGEFFELHLSDGSIEYYKSGFLWKRKSKEEIGYDNEAVKWARSKAC